MADEKKGASRLEIAGIVVILALGISIYLAYREIQRDLKEMEQAVVAHALINGKLPDDVTIYFVEDELKDAVRNAEKQKQNLLELMYRADRNATNLWFGQVTLPGGNNIAWHHIPKEKLSEFAFDNPELLKRVLQHIERDIADDGQHTRQRGKRSDVAAAILIFHAPPDAALYDANTIIVQTHTLKALTTDEVLVVPEPRVYFPDTVIDAKELALRGYSRGRLTSRIAELAQRHGIASESIASRYLALKGKWMTQEVRLPVVDLSLSVLPAIFSLTLVALWQLLMLSAGLRGAQSPATWDPDPIARTSWVHRVSLNLSHAVQLAGWILIPLTCIALAAISIAIVTQSVPAELHAEVPKRALLIALASALAVVSLIPAASIYLSLLERLRRAR